MGLDLGFAHGLLTLKKKEKKNQRSNVDVYFTQIISERKIESDW